MAGPRGRGSGNGSKSIIRRRRPACAAAAADRLFPRTPYGTTVWACVVFERYVGRRPLNGVAAWLSHHGLPISAGTLAGGLARLAPAFEGLSRAILEHQNEAAVRHGDETDWCRAWLERIASIYRLNKARLSHYRPGLEQQDEAFAATQQTLQTELKRLFATAERELAVLGETAPEAGPLRSLLNHRDGLSVFLQRPDVPMDNNIVERTLRGAVIARRLSFGSDSHNGARCTAMMYTAVETLALNGIDVRRWLQEWLKACAANAGRAPPDLSQWLPWSMSQARRRTLMAPG